ncbi:MAG TPA: M23 family metallopeptidase [Candidatus Corynebacterium gallistercoris]|uniref:M23 family metallopeptidase n=1 Tax=Candidatus Corynebacterium gallistercoris TaxID=2838530 RepID=A0A9D1RZP4_9CORY|nr:M23 family metallopeptidase [Candidatus Corynebacterium gallistercoris]
MTRSHHTTWQQLLRSSLIATALTLLLASPPPPSHAATTPPPSPAQAQVSRTHKLPIPWPKGEEPRGAVAKKAEIPDKPWLPGHRGVDLVANPGDAIYASRGGVIAFSGMVAGTPVVSVQHASGLRTTYEPVVAEVRAGDSVRRGQRIGILADTTTLSETARKSPGLSWGARLPNGHYVDPMTLLGPVRVRLYWPK